MVVMEAQPSGAAASGATTLGQAAPEPGRGSNVDPGRDTQAPVPPQADTAEATGAAVPPVMILSLAFFVAGRAVRGPTPRRGPVDAMIGADHAVTIGNRTTAGTVTGTT